MGSTVNNERACWRCQMPSAEGLVCARCGAPQPLAAGTDLFRVLGLPRQLVVDAEDLERRYHAASRAVHPDRHQTSDPGARDLSLTVSAAVNRAYRTLRDPVARGRYWLELHGMALGEKNNAVPPALAALVFDTQEKLEQLRAARGGAVERLRTEARATREELARRLRDLETELTTHYGKWSANGGSTAADLAELKRRLSEIAYLRTLHGDVEAALEEKWNELSA
jgi:molecular chaperone HscB